MMQETASQMKEDFITGSNGSNGKISVNIVQWPTNEFYTWYSGLKKIIKNLVYYFFSLVNRQNLW